MKKTLVFLAVFNLMLSHLFANDGSYVLTDTSDTGSAMPINNPDPKPGPVREKHRLQIHTDHRDNLGTADRKG